MTSNKGTIDPDGTIILITNVCDPDTTNAYHDVDTAINGTKNTTPLL